mmetsp:Transcript_65333/g.188159  ORF Transcript_65333/g.188159 Transcript_65333/m.188159 type:complete len:481 (-) Transcript_65333:1914-3356(-)
MLRPHCGLRPALGAVERRIERVQREQCCHGPRVVRRCDVPRGEDLPHYHVDSRPSFAGRRRRQRSAESVPTVVVHLPIRHHDDRYQRQLRHERAQRRLAGHVHQGRGQGRGRDVLVHRWPDHKREVLGLHQRPPRIGRHCRPLRQRREGRHPQCGPQRLQGRGHPGHARELVDVLHRANPQELAHVVVFQPRRGRDAESGTQIPGARQLHSHRLVPAMADGCVVQRWHQVLGLHRAVGSAGQPRSCRHLGVHAFQLRVVWLRRAQVHVDREALCLHHAEKLLGVDQVVYHDGRPESRRLGGPKGSAFERPHEIAADAGGRQGLGGGSQGESGDRGREGTGRRRLRGGGRPREGECTGGVREGQRRSCKLRQDRRGCLRTANILRGGSREGCTVGEDGRGGSGCLGQKRLPGVEGLEQAAWRRGLGLRGRDALAGRVGPCGGGGQEGQCERPVLEGLGEDDECAREVPAELEGLQDPHQRG